MDSAEILTLLARTLAREQTAAQGAGHLAARLCDACTEILGAEAVMLTLTSAAERLTVRTAKSAGSTVAQIEDLQVVLGEGPAELALAEGRTVVAHLDGHDTDAAAFPMFATLAAASDEPLTVYAVPMRPSGHVVGVLSVYLSGEHLARPLEEAELLADAAGAALLGDPGTADIRSQPAWPQQALVHQATGAVVAQLGIAPADALAVLRAHAFARASTLESVVDDVLARRLDFSCDGAENDHDGTAPGQHPPTDEP